MSKSELEQYVKYQGQQPNAQLSPKERFGIVSTSKGKEESPDAQPNTDKHATPGQEDGKVSAKRKVVSFKVRSHQALHLVVDPRTARLVDTGHTCRLKCMKVSALFTCAVFLT